MFDVFEYAISAPNSAILIAVVVAAVVGIVII